MKLPSYPLITVDPFFSIWSKSDLLYESNTVLWCGIEKRLKGTLSVDNNLYRFMGKGVEPHTIPQTSVDVTPYITAYTFKNDLLTFTVKFWTPLLLDDLYDLSLPCSFIEYELAFNDDEEHNVDISLYMNEDFCYNQKKKAIAKEIVSTSAGNAAKMGCRKQKPLHKSGDVTSADWGCFYLFGGAVSTDSFGIHTAHKATVKGSAAFTDIAAYDDIYSIEYMGTKYRALWTERHKSIEEAIAYCSENRNILFNRLLEQNKLILSGTEDFDESYRAILTTAARQVLAAHKLFRNCKGELLYFSKECNSNGCINTVDVTYPAIPMFLLYRPELVKAMLTGIFEFSRNAAWKHDFAPHDIGQYPIANGQVYGIYRLYNHKKKSVYKMKKDVINPNCHMPIEECGNMLITSYVYYLVTKDKSQLEENFDLLKKWANYLIRCSVVLENQLCTDDFAGHSEKNVNLAIKSIMGIACFSEIAKLTGNEDNSLEIAKQYADELTRLSKTENGWLAFSIGNEESWSLKYNLVWDRLLGFNLFDKSIYKAETEKYHTVINKYGTPLDYRKDFTKTDWMLWASCLDETAATTNAFSECILNYLADTKDKNCFTDWYDTVKATECCFNHRSVQAGLWMPVLKKKLLSNESKELK